MLRTAVYLDLQEQGFPADVIWTFKILKVRGAPK